ncbi:ABC transporter substrate-binding protein [Paremcibacter congregatus]|uniref:ABC transporter substrate-binding protein n=1 Tax=Paremcibacter congregatus TaxID=2043170 RepID=UPI0030EF6C9B|tara:strand:+ start:880 stop:1779 length:900 start_codon:yes stop_codon:yes gene_type:complete
MKNAAAHRMRNLLPTLAAFFVVLSPQGLFATEKPQAVSLDYCADQFLLSLADRNQIMALTEDAIEDHSFYRDQAVGLPLFQAHTEQVLRLNPDVVVRYWGGYKMLPLLDRTSIKVASAAYGTGAELLYKNIRIIAEALDQQRRAEDMIEDYKTRLKAVEAKTAAFTVAHHGLRAAYITPGGITAGENTFVNDMIKQAGFLSFAEEAGLKGWQPLPLEALVQNPPDVIIGSFFDMEKLHVSNWSLSRHHRIRKMIDNIPSILIPGRYLSCNGIFSVDAIEYIQTATEKFFPPVPSRKDMP